MHLSMLVSRRFRRWYFTATVAITCWYAGKHFQREADLASLSILVNEAQVGSLAITPEPNYGHVLVYVSVGEF